MKIGRFFAEEWQLAKNNEGSFYTPIPSVNMTLDELNQIKDLLEGMVVYWRGQTDPQVNTAWEAIANAEAIADLEQSKLDAVNSIIQLKTQQSGGGVVVAPTEVAAEEIPATNGNGSGSMLLPLLLVAGGIWFISRRRKKRRSTRKRKR